MKENFMADAFIQARWREPALDGQASQVRVSVLLSAVVLIDLAVLFAYDLTRNRHVYDNVSLKLVCLCLGELYKKRKFLELQFLVQ